MSDDDQRTEFKFGSIETLELCPYILSPWHGSGREIEWMIKKYPEYWDYIVFKDGKPSETHRLFLA